MSIGVTLLGQMITFAIFVLFTMRFVWPALAAALEERKQKIAAGLAAAEQGKQFLATAAEQAKAEIKLAKDKGNEIIASATKQSLQIIEEAKHAAQQERDHILAAGRAMLQQELSQTKLALQAKVADIAVHGAEKILLRNITAADQQALLASLVQEMAG